MKRFLVLLLLVPALARAQQSDSLKAQQADSLRQPDSVLVDSVFLRAQRMVAEGQGDSGRALVQAQLDSAPVGSPRYIEALYWHAVVAATAADAERDLRTIIVQYPLSPWSADALMRLAQLEMTRGDNDQALAHLQRVVVEHPDSPARARTEFWMARVLFDKGNAPAACARLADASRGTPASQVELRNQIDYLNQRCAGVDTTAAPESTAVAKQKMTPSAAVKQRVPPFPRSTRATGTRVAPMYTIQVAAYRTRKAADALLAVLRARGFDARIYGSQQPYRVRIGRYHTRAEADAVARKMRAEHITAYVTEAEPQ